MSIKKDIIILGAGGHAKVLVSVLHLLADYRVIGIADPDPTKLGDVLLREKIIGTDEVLKDFNHDVVCLVNGVGANIQLRKTIYQTYVKQGYRFPTIIHPSAIISTDVLLAAGVQVMAGAVIQPDTQINENSIINTRVSVDHDCVIGAHVHIAPGATLCGNVHIDEGSFIGAGAVILPNIRIAEKCIIGAGAVVTRHLNKGEKVMGVPARGFINEKLA